MCRPKQTRAVLSWIGIRYILLFSILLPGLCACVPSQAPSSRNLGPVGSPSKALLSCFLNLEREKGTSGTLVINSVEIQGEDKRWIALLNIPVAADASVMTTAQMFLGRASIPPGYYDKVRIRTAIAGDAPLTTGAEKTLELSIVQPLYVGARDSKVLFLNWNPQAAKVAIDTQNVLSLAPKVKYLLADVAYVACPDIDTVFMICTDKNQVCDSLGVKGAPTYLISDPFAPTANLYILSEQDVDIKRMGPASNRIETSYYLSRLGRGLHFTISPDSRWAYVIDQKRGNILKLNLASGAIETRNRLSYGPSFILYLKQQNLLAVSLSQSQTVVLLDPQSLVKVQEISTASKPQGLLQFRNTLLYIAESGSHSVMIYDLARNAMQKRIPVGLSPQRILEVDGNIFVANRASNSLSFLRPGQLGVSRSIELGGSPFEMAYSRDSRWIYVGNGPNSALDIINPESLKRVGQISLGARPEGIAILH